MIIGQLKLLDDINTSIENNMFPQFSLIIGTKGSGKKLIANYIATKLSADNVITVTPNIEGVRNMINTAKSVSGTTVFIIADADKLSTPAKNSLLKILEEPPKDMYFIMTVSDLGSMLNTILSRARVFYISPYTSKELLEYAYMLDSNMSEEASKLVISLCEVPGDVKLLLSNNPVEFYNFVESVVENIATVSGANSFKIADKLNLKDDEDKYDVLLFLRAFMTICLDSSSTDMLKYLNAVTLTSEYLSSLGYAGANKQMIFDNWLLAIRKAWM